MLIKHKSSLEVSKKMPKELILMKLKNKHKILINNYFYKILCMIMFYLMKMKIKVSLYIYNQIIIQKKDKFLLKFQIAKLFYNFLKTIIFILVNYYVQIIWNILKVYNYALRIILNNYGLTLFIMLMKNLMNGQQMY